MLVQLEVRNSRGNLLSIPLGEVSDGLLVEDIEGLEPVKATLVSTSFANGDGEQYHSSRREARDIVVKLEMVPEFTGVPVRETRNRLYEYFMPKSRVDLKFIMSDGLAVDISGVVEDFVAPLFTQEPKVSIPIRCFDPDFFDPTPVQIIGKSTSGIDEILLDYDGTVETGILFTFLPNRFMNEFTIYHRPPDGTLRTMEFSATLEPGDVLKINTVMRQKSAILNNVAAISSVLYGISPQSSWIELQPGPNRLSIYAEGEPVPYNIEYTTKYGGL